jgi:hypothetical protein
MGISAASLVGAWSFVDWTITTNGRTTKPFQPSPSGYIVYAENGIMSAVISAGNRAPFPSDDIRKRPDTEKAAAFDSYFHYAGNWHVEGDTVIHTVTAALNPNMIGTQQIRDVKLSGDTLVLSANELLEGGKGTRRHELTWRRV